ncbi:hypothetical protein PoB_005942800 [Plakobranchus ocellatus]|uniref:Uncharacterized protein n=1 Tax=Plakobranchus ocellatus TaxID=259542 RepID=A0AAV4CN44_9GAST|nr:hypothetical protein PoB_005942800 [Plakobranchus ocellatus]
MWPLNSEVRKQEQIGHSGSRIGLHWDIILVLEISNPIVEKSTNAQLVDKMPSVKLIQHRKEFLKQTCTEKAKKNIEGLPAAVAPPLAPGAIQNLDASAAVGAQPLVFLWQAAVLAPFVEPFQPKMPCKEANKDMG